MTCFHDKGLRFVARSGLLKFTLTRLKKDDARW